MITTSSFVSPVYKLFKLGRLDYKVENLTVGNDNIYDRAFADLHGCLDLLSYADSYIERHFTEVIFLMPCLVADLSFRCLSVMSFMAWDLSRWRH